MGLSSYYLSVADVTTAVPLLPLVTGWVGLWGLFMSSTQWQEGVDNFRGETGRFRLYSLTVPRGSGGVVASLCGKVKRAELYNVVFDGGFGEFGGDLREEVGRCEELEFIGSTASKYRGEIVKLGERMGWRVERDDGNAIVIKKV